MRNPRIFANEETMYIQPDIQAAEMGEGSRIEDGNQNICQRANGKLSLGIADWLHANRTSIITVLAMYGGYRILRR